MATSPAVGKKRGRPKSTTKKSVRGAAATKPKTTAKKVSGAAAPKKAAPKKAAVGAAKPKTTAKKVSNAAVGKTLKVGDKRYTKSACYGNKADATTAAKKIRTSGKLARVVDGCVFVRNKD